VTKVDVEAVLTNGSVRARPAPKGEARTDERVPLRGLRKRIAEKMVRSKHNAPHFTFVEEVDVTELVRLRKRLNEGLRADKDATKLTFLPLILKALVPPLRDFPYLNANFDEATQELVVRADFHFGIAVATDARRTRGVGSECARLLPTRIDRRFGSGGIVLRGKIVRCCHGRGFRCAGNGHDPGKLTPGSCVMKLSVAQDVVVGFAT